MAKIDRLGWVEGLAFRSYGVRIGIRVNGMGLIPQLTSALPPGWKPSKSPIVDRLYSIIAGGESSQPRIRLLNLVYANATRIARVRDFEETVRALETDLQLHVAEMSPRRVFVHAGVVALGGKAIVIPGRSFSGKTTLVAELVKAGATYYSDEYAVLDESGRVHAYARPLSIREGGRLDGPTRVEVESLGGKRGAKPLDVGLVLITEYHQGARWRPRRLSPGEGVVALLANTVPARRRPAEALATFQKVVSAATVFKSARGDADSLVNFVREQGRL
jgi:serine kinase of HPr protein (carbohydrate metabolism regulator)